jgi:hypothetical protein
MFAALTAYSDDTAETADGEVTGDLVLPGGVRGRFRARKAPERPHLVPMVMAPRFDLFDGTDSTFTAFAIDWPSYAEIRARALHVQAAEFEGIPGLILAILSGTDEEARVMADRLRTAEPLGVTFGEAQGGRAMVLTGKHDSYVLIHVGPSHREQLALWWHKREKCKGAHAVLVTDTHPDGDGADWNPKTVHALFEFGGFGT